MLIKWSGVDTRDFTTDDYYKIIDFVDNDDQLMRASDGPSNTFEQHHEHFIKKVKHAMNMLSATRGAVKHKSSRRKHNPRYSKSSRSKARLSKVKRSKARRSKARRNKHLKSNYDKSKGKKSKPKKSKRIKSKP